jgi:hypothetical protein
MSGNYWRNSIWIRLTRLKLTLMVVRALEKETDPFQPRQEGKEVLSPEYTYLSIIGALMYLVNNTRADIAFVVNLLIRFSATPIMQH